MVQSLRNQTCWVLLSKVPWLKETSSKVRSHKKVCNKIGLCPTVLCSGGKNVRSDVGRDPLVMAGKAGSVRPDQKTNVLQRTPTHRPILVAILCASRVCAFGSRKSPIETKGLKWSCSTGVTRLSGLLGKFANDHWLCWEIFVEPQLDCRQCRTVPYHATSLAPPQEMEREDGQRYLS